jgi:hypothetical protein
MLFFIHSGGCQFARDFSTFNINGSPNALLAKERADNVSSLTLIRDADLSHRALIENIILMEQRPHQKFGSS